MKKISLYLLVVAALAALGGWFYWTQHGPPKTAIEIGAKSGATGGAGAAGGSGPSGGSGQAGGAGGPAAAGGSGPAGARPAAGQGGPRGAVGVEVATARTAALTDEVFAVGNLRANESVMVRPETAGRVVKIGFTEGALIRRGDLLVELDRSVLLAQVEQAKAELDLSKANYDRTADLAERKFVSLSAKDQAAANLSVQEAKLRLAEAQLAKTRIFAPFSGVVGLRNFSEGDYVREGADLVVIEDVSRVKVDLRLPERYLGDLRLGQTIEVRVDAHPQRGFRATLAALDAQVSADGRALVARGILDNQDLMLRTGMFVRARLVLKEKPAAVMIPEEAVYPMGASTYVYQVVDGKAIRAKVATGLRRDGQVEVTEGIAAGDVVIIAGQIKISRDGTEVRVQNAPSGGGQAGAGQAASPARPAQQGAGPGGTGK